MRYYRSNNTSVPSGTNCVNNDVNVGANLTECTTSGTFTNYIPVTVNYDVTVDATDNLGYCPCGDNNVTLRRYY